MIVFQPQNKKYEKQINLVQNPWSFVQKKAAYIDIVNQSYANC